MVMGMPAEGEFFPPSPRVFYEKAPLTQVICQLRFPPVLRIENPPPAEFQERIRHIFPLLERTQGQIAEVPPELAQLMGITQGRIEFTFRTEDGKTTLTLGAEAIALATTAYTIWDRFLEHLQPALDALLEIYKPSFFQRVGLRYINTIQRSTMGIENQEWSELLRPSILGELSLPQFEANATEVKRSVRVNLPNEEGCGLFLQHGFAKKQGLDEVLYRLDFDFYRSDKTEVTDAKPTIDRFNAMVGRTFRGCITEKLHQSLGPVPL